MQRVVLGVDREPVGPGEVGQPQGGPWPAPQRPGQVLPALQRGRHARGVQHGGVEGQPQLRRIAASRKAWSTSAICTTSTSPRVRYRSAANCSASGGAASSSPRSRPWMRIASAGTSRSGRTSRRKGGRGGPAADHPQPPGGHDRVGGRVRAWWFPGRARCRWPAPGRRSGGWGMDRWARTGSGRSVRPMRAGPHAAGGLPAVGACSGDQVGLEGEAHAFLVWAGGRYP